MVRLMMGTGWLVNGEPQSPQEGFIFEAEDEEVFTMSQKLDRLERASLELKDDEKTAEPDNNNRRPVHEGRQYGYVPRDRNMQVHNQFAHTSPLPVSSNKTR